MREGLVKSFQEYYENAQKKSIQFSWRVAELKPILKIIEDCENTKVKQLPPLKPMLDQLNEYIELNQIQRFEHASDVLTALRGKKSQYYNACYSIVKVMLREEIAK